jgi:hypothetical protein
MLRIAPAGSVVEAAAAAVLGERLREMPGDVASVMVMLVARVEKALVLSSVAIATRETGPTELGVQTKVQRLPERVALP